MKIMVFIISLLQVFLFSGFASGAEKIAIVKTKENYIREFDRFYAPVKAKVQFEEKLSVIETKNEWIHVRYKDVDGWIHKAAVTEGRKMTYKPVMLGSEIDPETENDEVALAGKGFTPEVEKKVGENNPDLNFAMVDEIVNYELPPGEINSFIKEGGLNCPK